MVYVISKNGQPLMPTCRHGKVRHLLKDGKAKVIKRCPFTIQLLYETTEFTQPVTLGIDAGSKHIGISATTENKELYAAEVGLRTDITKLLSARRELRRSRRNRKTRYRISHVSITAPEVRKRAGLRRLYGIRSKRILLL